MPMLTQVTCVCQQLRIHAHPLTGDHRPPKTQSAALRGIGCARHTHGETSDGGKRDDDDLGF